MVDSLSVLAVDLGASSGRVIKCTLDDGFELKQVHKFRNAPIHKDGHLRWDVESLWREVTETVKAGSEESKSIGVDTWGVDFGLLDQHGKLLEDPVHYRDPRTSGMMEWVFERISRREIFDKTGVQFLQLNTLYQLASLSRKRSELLNRASTYLGFPDLFNYWLTGEKRTEYTHATTTQCFNPTKRRWEPDILDAIGVQQAIFPEIIYPGENIGEYREMKVAVPACHDTGSAVVAVPSTSNNICYLSSGTWSLMGTETKTPIINDDVYRLNFTNEGGAEETNRLLRNLPGLWLEQELLSELNREDSKLSYDELVNLASGAEAFRSLINPADPLFNAPGAMTIRITQYCRDHGEPEPRTIGEHIRCIYDSLALSYHHCLQQLESITGKNYPQINIIGGGSLNRLLNQNTADITGRRVVAGPVEATALGNTIIQFKILGHLRDVGEARKILSETQRLQEYTPTDGLEWEDAYIRYKLLLSS